MSEQSASHTAGRRALANTVFRAGAELVGKGATFLLFAVLTRRVSEESVGAYVLAFAYVQIVTILIDLGFDRVVTLRVAKDVTTMPQLFTDVVALKLVIAIPVTLGSWAVANLIGYDEQTRVAIYLLTLGLLFDSLIRTVVAVMTARESGGLLSLGLIAQRATGATLGIAALVGGLGVYAICITYAIGSGFGLGLGIVLMSREVARPARGICPADWPALLRASLPFALYDSIDFVLTKVDTVLLSILASTAAIGYYGAASRLYESSFFITFSLHSAFVAMFTYLTRTSAPTVGVVFERAIKLALLLLLPIAVTVAVDAGDIAALLFGDDFRSAGDPLRWLAPAIVLMGVVNLSSALVAMRKGARTMIPFATGVLLLNIILNLVLIPPLSDAGAAVAMSISLGVFAVLGLALAAREVGGLPVVRMIAAPLLAGAAMAAALVLVPQPLVALLVGGGMFAAVYLVAERMFSPGDLAFVLATTERILRRNGADRSA